MSFSLLIQAKGANCVTNYRVRSGLVRALCDLVQPETTVLEFQKREEFFELVDIVRRTAPLCSKEDLDYVCHSAISLAAIAIYSSKLGKSEVLVVPLVEPSHRSWGVFRDCSVFAAAHGSPDYDD